MLLSGLHGSGLQSWNIATEVMGLGMGVLAFVHEDACVVVWAHKELVVGVIACWPSAGAHCAWKVTS